MSYRCDLPLRDSVKKRGEAFPTCAAAFAAAFVLLLVSALGDYPLLTLTQREISPLLFLLRTAVTLMHLGPGF